MGKVLTPLLLITHKILEHVCYDDYLAEKLPINKTKLPSVLQPDYNPANDVRHVDELQRVPDRDMSKRARRKAYIDAFECAANVANMCCRELEQCLLDLLFRHVYVMNELQLAIWYASHLDQGTESESLAPRSRPTMEEDVRYQDWSHEWMTMQPRDHETRTSILRKATWDTTHNLSDQANLHALRWLREMTHCLNHPEIPHGYKLAKAFMSDPHVIGHYLAVWFVHDAYQGKYRGTINPMRGLHVMTRRMNEERVAFIECANSIDYQEYMTHRCMMDDLEYMQANPGESNGYKFNCCCKCCQEKQLIDHIKVAHQELDTILEKRGVKLALQAKKVYKKRMEMLRDYIYKVNTEASFELVMSEDVAFVGDTNEMGTESYNRLYVELKK